MQLVKLVGRLWVFFLSHTVSGFQWWFYFHLCMWIVHGCLLRRLPWRSWVCPCEGQVWRWYSCLGCRGSGITRYSRGFPARAAGNTVFQKGMATCIGLYAPVIFPGEPPSLTEKPGRPQSTGLQSPGHDRRDPACIEARLFFGMWQLCPSESCM